MPSGSALLTNALYYSHNELFTQKKKIKMFEEAISHCLGQCPLLIYLKNIMRANAKLI